MSAMSVEMVEQEADFVEGSLDLSDTAKWYCEEHGSWIKTGKDCLFCSHDLFGDAMLDYTII